MDMTTDSTTPRLFVKAAIAAILFAVATIGGCSCDDDKKSSPPACAQGSETCPCNDEGSCDGDLSCVDNVCVGNGESGTACFCRHQ